MTKPKLNLIPEAFKSGFLGTQKPFDGSGDFTVVRNSTATRINRNREVEEVAVNVPRIDYLNGCNELLIEPQSTNILLNSETLTTQTRTVTAVAHTLSFYGTGSVTLSGVFSGSLVGTGVNNRVTLTFTPTSGSLTLTVSGSVKMGQLETGSFASSYINTLGTTVTRVSDFITLNNLSNTLMAGKTVGTFYIEYERFSIGDPVDSVVFGQVSGDYRGLIFHNIVSFASPWTGFQTITQPKNKIVIRYDSPTTGSIFLNGVKSSHSGTAISNIDKIELRGQGGVLRIKQITMYDYIINDTQAVQLTTL